MVVSWTATMFYEQIWRCCLIFLDLLIFQSLFIKGFNLNIILVQNDLKRHVFGLLYRSDREYRRQSSATEMHCEYILTILKFCMIYHSYRDFILEALINWLNIRCPLSEELLRTWSTREELLVPVYKFKGRKLLHRINTANNFGVIQLNET